MPKMVHRRSSMRPVPSFAISSPMIVASPGGTTWVRIFSSNILIWMTECCGVAVIACFRQLVSKPLVVDIREQTDSAARLEKIVIGDLREVLLTVEIFVSGTDLFRHRIKV